jgi:outer membrane protein OmpA-like peptidoglycan-associated protein
MACFGGSMHHDPFWNAAGGRSGRRRLVLSLLFVLLSGGLHGQTAADMDKLLDSREITWAQACRFVLPAAGVLAEDIKAEAAFAAAREKGWLPKKAAAESPVNLGGLSFLVMRSFSMKGSFLYALFPGPRYAYRQLDYLRLLPGPRDPALKVSGSGLLYILGGVLNYLEGREESAEPGEGVGTAAPLSADLLAGREQMVREIRAELEARSVTDTTVRIVDEGVAISLNNIQFLPDDTALTEPERMKIMRIAVILTRYPGRKLLVGGHTARAGTPEGRLRISTRRAQAVADFLVYLDSRRPEEITVRGYGAERPLGDNGTAEGQALNRRVEITILDK